MVNEWRYKIMVGTALDCQAGLNQWMLEFKVHILEMCVDKGMVTLLLMRQRKNMEEGDKFRIDIEDEEVSVAACCANTVMIKSPEKYTITISKEMLKHALSILEIIKEKGDR